MRRFVNPFFYSALFGERKGRLESLELATAALRRLSQSDCAATFGPNHPVFLAGEKPFADAYFWGAFVLYGAW